MSKVFRWEKMRESSGAAVLLSIAVHLLLAVMLAETFSLRPRGELPAAITVEMVPEPAAKPKPAPKRPERAKPEPPKPEPPKPEAPKPPEPVKAPMAAAHPEVKPPPLPPKPQLERGKLAKKSHFGGAPRTGKKETVAAAELAPVAMPTPHRTEAMSFAAGSAKVRPGGVGEATQSERDFILSQVLSKWPKPDIGDADGVIHLRVEIEADGSLGPPFSASAPWAPEDAITDYDKLVQGDPRLALLLSIYSAVRLAQPLDLTPQLKAKAPFAAVLDFRLSDVRN